MPGIWSGDSWNRCRLTIWRNLALPLRLVAAAPKKEPPERVRAALEAVGLRKDLEGRLDMPAERLSGGRQQRLCLARTLALEPAALLLDEPTASLDVHAAEMVEELLLGIATTRPVIMVSHSLTQARRLGRQILICAEGRITGRLTGGQALSEELLAELLRFSLSRLFICLSGIFRNNPLFYTWAFPPARTPPLLLSVCAQIRCIGDRLATGERKNKHIGRPIFVLFFKSDKIIHF